MADICIYGGNSAGIIAAVTAHQLGKSVILIEPTAHLGGLSTGGLGQTDIGNKIAITGIARDFIKDRETLWKAGAMDLRTSCGY